MNWQVAGGKWQMASGKWQVANGRWQIKSLLPNFGYKKGDIMKIYIIRHGDAKSESEDIKRPLNEKGIQDIRKIGNFMKKLCIKIDKIYHSSKLRAKQTAEILSEYIEIKQGLIEITGLEPNADINILFDKFLEETEDFSIVGHLPYLSHFVSKLITGDENKSIIELKPASILCIEKTLQNNFIINFFISPEIC